MSDTPYTGARYDEMPSLWDGFANLVRPGLGLTAFGANVMNLPPDYETKAKAESAEEPELYTLRDKTGKDIEGRELERHSEAMFGISDEEERHRAEVDEELKKGPKSGRARAEAVYKRLRRADIKVTRTESGVDVTKEKVPGAWDKAPAICNPVRDEEIAKHYPQFNFH